MDDVVWIKKARYAVEGWDKCEPVQAFGLPSGLVGLINLELVNPKDVHADLV